MGTRCFIGKKQPDGKIKAVACTHDGDPSYMIPTLLEAYTDEKVIDALIAKGELSSIDVDIAKNDHYIDRGNDDDELWMVEVESLKEYAKWSFGDYLYVFMDGAWYVYFEGWLKIEGYKR